MFSVEPWEVESDNVNFVRMPHNIEWQNEMWELAVARVQPRNVLCFRRMGGPLLREMIFMKDRRRKPVSNVIERVTTRFIECMERNWWERELFLDSDLALRKGDEAAYSVALNSDGRGRVQQVGGKREFLTLPAGDCSRMDAGELLVQLKDEEDFRRARRLLSLSKRELWDEFWRCERGDIEELERVLTLAMAAHNEPDDMTMVVSLSDESSGEGRYLIQSSGSPRVPRPLSPDLQDTVERIMAWFGVQPKIQSTEVPASVPFCFVKTNFLTAHERIEASIKWREWLASTQG